MTHQEANDVSAEDQAGVTYDETQLPLTCSVHEFASIVGISRDRAYELVHSEFPPPGFTVCKGYRIIRARIVEYIDQLYERELSMRSRRR